MDSGQPSTDVVLPDIACNMETGLPFKVRIPSMLRKESIALLGNRWDGTEELTSSDMNGWSVWYVPGAK